MTPYLDVVFIHNILGSEWALETLNFQIKLLPQVLYMMSKRAKHMWRTFSALWDVHSSRSWAYRDPSRGICYSCPAFWTWTQTLESLRNIRWVWKHRFHYSSPQRKAKKRQSLEYWFIKSKYTFWVIFRIRFKQNL